MKLIIKLLLGFMFLSFYGQAQSSKSPFDRKLNKIIKKLDCPLPDEKDPVSLNAILVKEKNGRNMTVVIKVLVASGWHIYAYVPSNMPYITTKCILNLSDDITVSGDWLKSLPLASLTDQGVLNYENEVVFVRYLKLEEDSKGTIKAGISYQPCNAWQCLPPTKKIIELEY